MILELLYTQVVRRHLAFIIEYLALSFGDMPKRQKSNFIFEKNFLIEIFSNFTENIWMKTSFPQRNPAAWLVQG